jgi:hypothetical protein
LFRADTPHDVVCAGIVAGQLPAGRNVLALSCDKGRDDRARYLASLNAMASLHDWEAVVDLSGLPLRGLWGPSPAVRGAWGRFRLTLASVRFLRQRLAPVFGLDPNRRGLAGQLNGSVGEVYLTCLHHADVQLFYTLFPSARKVYYPHGFASVHKQEINFYAPYCAPGGRRPSWRSRLANLVKRLGWGKDAVQRRQFPLDAAFTFARSLPWVAENHRLTDWLDRERMAAFFNRLEPAVRDYYRTQAARCGERALLLLLHVSDADPSYPVERELEGTAEQVRQMIRKEDAGTVVVKPHPLNSSAWVEKVVARTREKVPGVTLVVIDQHQYCPIELVMSPFPITACAGIASSSLQTLHRIYGVPSYYFKSLLLDLYSCRADYLHQARVWISDVEKELVAVD